MNYNKSHMTSVMDEPKMETANVVDEDHAPPATLDVLVLVATQSFTAEQLVEEILIDCLHTNGWSVEARLVDEMGFDWSEAGHTQVLDAKPEPSPFLTMRARAILVVASTYGDGDPPNHALEFAAWLGKQSKHAVEEALSFPRNSCYYAVFGLGDCSYAHFAAFGRYVDEGLASRGLERLLSFTTGDAASGNQDGEFRTWCDHVSKALGQALERPLFGSRHAATDNKPAVPFPLGTGTEWRRSAIQPGSVTANITAFEQLLLLDDSSRSTRSVLHVSISLPSRLVPHDMQPGDHVGIYPRNGPAIVNKALRWLQISADSMTTIVERRNRDSAGDPPWVERHLSAFELLAVHVDLGGRATPSVLRSFLPFVGTLELRALARDLTYVETEHASGSICSSVFDAWVAGRRLTVLDLAMLFECRPSLQAFARACGPMQPRLYSVALVTSGKDVGNGAMTTVGVCMAVAEGGLCSNHVANLAKSSSDSERQLTVFFRPSRFRFIADGAPALLIAAGSGVGPCVGFIEEEIKRLGLSNLGNAAPINQSFSQSLSHICLFFGCRTPTEMLYRDRMSAFSNLGLCLYHAFSRVPGHRKDHVQDLIRREATMIWKAISSGGRMYVCGRLELLAGVRAALVEIGRVEGGLELEEAQRAVQAMEEEGKLRTDCWSVDTPLQQPLTEQRHYRPPHVVLRLERHHAHEQTSTRTQQSRDLSKIPAWPSYLRLLASGELERRVDRAMDMWTACVACGRGCETNRLSPDPKDWGECRVGKYAVVSSAFPHFGEEDCLVGTMGSGTIFFGACNLKCMYCQNWELSAMDQGDIFDDNQLAQTMLDLQKRGCHNINFVSPTHNLAPILRALLISARKGLKLPLVWNTGGFDSVAALRLLEDVVDIYMPDAKYANRVVGRKLSKVDNYPEINQAAIKEMHRQVGELQLDPKTGLARRGVLVRHLVLPCNLAGTCDVAAFLAKEVSRQTYTNIMDQYRPEHYAVKDKKFGLSRKPTGKELRDAHKQAKYTGLGRLDGEPKTKRSLDW